MFVVELDLGHLEAAPPVGLIPQTILKRAARVLLTDEELYRFRVVKLGKRIQAHGENRIGLSAVEPCLSVSTQANDACLTPLAGGLNVPARGDTLLWWSRSAPN